MNVSAKDLAALLPPLQDEVSWLVARWHAWRSLFAHNQARVDLLNESARSFFSMLQQSLATDVKVALIRLIDPSTTGQRRNLTLKRIAETLHAIGADGSDEFAESLVKVDTLCMPLRDERNRRLAHLDLDLALKLSPEPGGMKVEDIDAAVDAVTKCMTIAERAAGASQRMYEGWKSTINTDGLFRALAKAKEYDCFRDEGLIPAGRRINLS